MLILGEEINVACSRALVFTVLGCLMCSQLGAPRSNFCGVLVWFKAKALRAKYSKKGR